MGELLVNVINCSVFFKLSIQSEFQISLLSRHYGRKCGTTIYRISVPLLHVYYRPNTVWSTLCSLLQLILKTTQQDSLYYHHSLDDEEAEALGASLIQG